MRIAQLEMDMQYLRSTLIGMATLILAGLCIYGGAYFIEGRSEREYAGQEQRLGVARNGYFAAIEAQKTMAEYQDYFLSLRARGLIDDERRLDWIEHLKSRAGELDLPELTYSLGPREPFQLPPALNIAAPLSASRMQLEMKLFHEGDLLSLLDGLRKDDAGLFWVQSCDLKRKEISPGADKDVVTKEGMVDAKCELLWLTVNSTPESEVANE
ncbi:MAG: hypothetical protein V1706_07740 [Pseudomonadota bacterium]